MTRPQMQHPRVQSRDRHVSRNAPWNAKPMKKQGGGKGNWGVAGTEAQDFVIPVNEVFDDYEFRDDDHPAHQNGSKIQVMSGDVLHEMFDTSSEGSLDE